MASSFNEAFITIRQDETGRPHQVIRHNTNEGIHVASSIGICRKMLKDPRVKTAFKVLAVRFDLNSEAWYTDRSKDEVAEIFIDKITERFPIVFVDYSLTNPDYRACHWRRAGKSGIGFDIRKQSIVISGGIIENTCLAGKSAQGIKDPDAKERKRFRLFLFSIATTFLHELGHIFVTFLGGGKANTPPHIELQLHFQSVNSSGIEGEEGEAGAYFESLTFGGKVILFRDPAEDDKLAVIPYLITTAETRQISQQTIDEFVKCQFTFPFANLGPKRPAGMRTMGHGLPWIISRCDPMLMPETRQLLEGHPANPFKFEKEMGELMEDNPNPRTLSVQPAVCDASGPI